MLTTVSLNPEKRRTFCFCAKVRLACTGTGFERKRRKLIPQRCAGGQTPPTHIQGRKQYKPPKRPSKETPGKANATRNGGKSASEGGQKADPALLEGTPGEVLEPKWLQMQPVSADMREGVCSWFEIESTKNVPKTKVFGAMVLSLTQEYRVIPVNHSLPPLRKGAYLLLLCKSTPGMRWHWV